MSTSDAERADDVKRAAAALRAGAIVGTPTETFYGLAADPRMPEALAAVLRAKGREGADKPLLLLAATIDDIAPWVGRFPIGFEKLVAYFWPGSLTIILPAAAGVEAPLRGPTGGVAVRMTPQPLTRLLIRACGTAITGTSANRAGAPPATSAQQVRDAFGDDVAMVLDDGVSPGGQPSTLVEITDEGARVLRVGAIGTAELAVVVSLRPAP